MFKPLGVFFRLQQIGFLISRYGFVDAVASLGFEVGKRGVRLVAPRMAPKPVAFDEIFGRRLAALLAALGPTFIKLGQVLASRPDIMGENVARPLEVLFDRAPFVPFRKIEKRLRKEWGVKVFKAELKNISRVPLASASLSQIHRGILKNGAPVIIKVQKEGVAGLVKQDLLILETLATTANLIYPRFQLKQIFFDFKEATLKELDYREEAKNIDTFHQRYSRMLSSSGMVFPHYYANLSTERVLVLEPLHGKKLSLLKGGGRLAKRAAVKSVTTVLEQIFNDGFFHADPHAGNLFFLEETGQIGFIDLGLVGKLEEKDKKRFLNVLMAIFRRDRERLAQSLFELGTPSPKTQYSDFERAVGELIDRLKDKKQLRLDQIVSELLLLSRKNSIHIPNRYVMMARSCLILEGMAKTLDPSLSIIDLAIPVVARGLLKTYSPLRWFRG